MTKVYIAGKITGSPDYKADFQRAASNWSATTPAW